MDLHTLTTDELDVLTTYEMYSLIIIYRPPYVYTPDGNLIHLGGCSTFDVGCTYVFAFNAGEFAYSRWKAREKGVLEKYCIKKVKYMRVTDALGHQLCQYGPEPSLYMDTQNDFHEATELCTREEALDLIEQYLTEQEELARSVQC